MGFELARINVAGIGAAHLDADFAASPEQDQPGSGSSALR